MTQYNKLNVTISNLQFNKLKSGTKNGSEVTLYLSSNVTINFNDEINFAHKLLITHRQIKRLTKAFGNNSLANVKLLKAYLSKIVQAGGFPLGRLLEPIQKKCLAFNKEMYDIKKIVKSLKESGYLRKCVRETHKNEAKEQKSIFLSMLLETFGAILLGYLLKGKEIKAKIPGPRLISAGEGKNKTGWHL